MNVIRKIMKPFSLNLIEIVRFMKKKIAQIAKKHLESRRTQSESEQEMRNKEKLHTFLKMRQCSAQLYPLDYILKMRQCSPINFCYYVVKGESTRGTILEPLRDSGMWIQACDYTYSCISCHSIKIGRFRFYI
jgi:Na+-transporting NADH:ubiquinone oxidoreductase subunit NqrC